MPAKETRPVRVGVLSDTHGSLNPAVLDVFAGVDHIIHAGDIGSPHILLELEAIAPVTAVLGNTDHAHAGMHLHPLARVVIGGRSFVVVHDAADVPREAGADIVVTGHTHRPDIRRAGGVLHVNPGSVSRPRGGSAASVAVLEITGTVVSARLIPLPGA